MQSSPDILRGVKQCQHFIACFTGAALLPTVCARLIAIADNLTPPRPALVDAAKRASNMPSSSDRVATVDELRDHSPDFVVLETLHAVFAHQLQRWYQVGVSVGVRGRCGWVGVYGGAMLFLTCSRI